MEFNALDADQIAATTPKDKSPVFLPANTLRTLSAIMLAVSKGTDLFTRFITSSALMEV